MSTHRESLDGHSLENGVATLALGPEDEAVGHKISEIAGVCEQILDEIDHFEEFSKQNQQDGGCELRHFKSGVKAELKFIEKLAADGADTERTAHTLRSSNVGHYSAVWSAAKSSAGVIALTKRFYWQLPPPPQPKNGSLDKKKRSKKSPSKATSAVVDIVAENGAQWIKVSAVSQNRILFDLAKAGWVEWSDDDSDDSFGPQREDDDDDRSLVKQADALVKAARATRVQYRHPKILFLLPKLTQGESKYVDEQIEKIRNMGIEVRTAAEIPEPSLPMADLVSHMVVDPYATITPTINVDCTILLAFISDISYSRVEAEDWHHRAILHQIEVEREDKLLPTTLWRACGSRRLICTAEAAQRMQEIVDTIGTEPEQMRSRCLVECEHSQGWSREKRITELQKLSDYEVPKDWQLPIEIVALDEPELEKNLPPAARYVEPALSKINRSVFFYGWATGWTTISSNRTVAKEIEALIEKNRKSDDDGGPDIWLSPTSRSLVGKEKVRRGFRDEN